MPPLTQAARERLTATAEIADRSAAWPKPAWDTLRDEGVLRWSIPAEWGGVGWSAVEQMLGSEAIAGCCLTTAFILSQREAAVRRLLKGPRALIERYLPRSAAGDEVLTVGLSQLTTSRQHGRPALIATPAGGGSYRLDGQIPWVTAADRAMAFVAGATLEDGSQLLFVLPADRPGIVVGPPLDLAALAGSRTCLVQCQDVMLHADDILAGPMEKVLGAGGGGGLETSCLAIGLAGASLDLLESEAAGRADIATALRELGPTRDALRRRLHQAAVDAPDPERILHLRADSTLYALRATQTALLTAKGTGFVAPHPAQRWARQALFFLVWSCPRSVSDGVRAGLFAGLEDLAEGHS